MARCRINYLVTYKIRAPLGGFEQKVPPSTVKKKIKNDVKFHGQNARVPLIK